MGKFETLRKVVPYGFEGIGKNTHVYVLKYQKFVSDIG